MLRHVAFDLSPILLEPKYDNLISLNNKSFISKSNLFNETKHNYVITVRHAKKFCYLANTYNKYRKNYANFASAILSGEYSDARKIDFINQIKSISNTLKMIIFSESFIVQKSKIVNFHVIFPQTFDDYTWKLKLYFSRMRCIYKSGELIQILLNEVFNSTMSKYNSYTSIIFSKNLYNDRHIKSYEFKKIIENIK